MGLAAPILLSWVKAARTSCSGWMLDNFWMMTSTASMTPSVSFSNLVQFSASEALCSLRVTSYSFKMSNWTYLFSMSCSNWATLAERV